MEKPVKNQIGKTPAVSVLKILFVMYILTGICLVILAALLYKFELKETVVNIAIIVIYILIGFVGGFLAGKILKVRKFMWGAIIGAVYFLVLVMISLILHRSLDNDMLHFATTFILCVASGMAGGMVS